MEKGMIMEIFVTGTEQIMQVHNVEDCKGKYCCIHNPSDHHMKDWPLHWREDRRFFERIDPEGVGHPDPDEVEYNKSKGVDISIHGCNGLCNPVNFKKYNEEKDNQESDKMNIDWKEEFKYFLEQNNVWDQYKELTESYKGIPFEKQDFKSPRYFIIDAFNWSISNYRLWDYLDGEWLSYYEYWSSE